MGARRVGRKAGLFVVFVLVELGRIPEPQDLTTRVAREDAVWPFGFERDDGDVPGASTERGSYAAARQPFKRFELEDRWCRPDVIERSSRNCHSAPPSPASNAI